MIRQRLRGVLGTTIVACIPWTALGVVTGVVLQFNLVPGMRFALGRPVPGGFITVCALAGVLAGVVNGLTFSGIVLATERGRTLEELRGWRFAAWGAVATAAPLGLFLESPLAAGIGAVAGGIGAIAALWLARRPRQPIVSAPST